IAAGDARRVGLDVHDVPREAGKRVHALGGSPVEGAVGQAADEVAHVNMAFVRREKQRRKEWVQALGWSVVALHRGPRATRPPGGGRAWGGDAAATRCCPPPRSRCRRTSASGSRGLPCRR